MAEFRELMEQVEAYDLKVQKEMDATFKKALADDRSGALQEPPGVVEKQPGSPSFRKPKGKGGDGRERQTKKQKVVRLGGGTH